MIAVMPLVDVSVQEGVVVHPVGIVTPKLLEHVDNDQGDRQVEHAVVGEGEIQSCVTWK